MKQIIRFTMLLILMVASTEATMSQYKNNNWGFDNFRFGEQRDPAFSGDEYAINDLRARVKDLEKDIQNLGGEYNNSNDNMLLWIVAGVACVLSILALIKSGKKEKHHHNHNSNEYSNIHDVVSFEIAKYNLKSNFENAEKKLCAIEEYINKKKAEEAKNNNNNRQQPIVSQPPTPVAAVQPQHSVIYVEPDSQKADILFKQTNTLSDRHLYEIHLESSDATQGELHIRKGLSAEYTKKYIDGRNDYLKVCEIGNSSATASRIEMKKSGRVVKNQNEWKVIVPPVVDLV